jgi:MFS family permease
VLLALVGSSAASWVFIVAISVYAYAQGGAGWVGLIHLARSLAGALSSPVAGVVADRYPRRMVMAWSDIGRVALLVIGAVVVWQNLPLPLLLVVSCAVSIVGAPFPNALFAQLPELADEPALLSAANAATGTVLATAVLVGPAVGALILTVSGPAAVFLAAAAGALWSAVLILRGPAGDGGREPAGEAADIRSELAVGFVTVRGDRRLQLLLMTVAVITFSFGALNVLVVALAFAVLHTGDAGASLLFTANGVGSVVGAVLAAGVVAARPGLALAAGTAAMGVTLALSAASDVAAVAALMLAANGLVTSIADVADTTLGQRLAPGELLGRYMGIAIATAMAATAIGSIATPLLIHLTTVRGATALVGAFLLVAALVCWRAFTALDATPVAAADLVEALRHDPIFAPLSQAAIEQLARGAVREPVDAGTVVVREGDPGDRYYLVEAGSAEAAVAGASVRRIATGEGFGEIALLRDTPRTATVTTLEPTTLLVVGRDDFLGALAESPTSRRTADVLAATRLAA